MGIYHAYMRDADETTVRCFCGLVNPCTAEPPQGIDEITDEPQKPHIRFEYDDAGKLSRVFYVNAQGERSAMPGSRVAEQRLQYDKAGRLSARRNYDAAGTPVADAAGVASREFEYDPSGRMTARVLKNADGQKIVPRLPGYAEEQIAYDEKGRPLTVRYLDGLGQPIVNVRGESVVQYTYNDAQNEVVRTNYVNGKPTDNKAGVAQTLVRRTADGHAVHTSWRNASGKAVPHNTGLAYAVLEEFKPEISVRRTRRCSEQGLMMENARVWAEHLVRTTPAGKLEWECYNGADGLPCFNHECGYAERVCEYADNGQLSCEYFWDAIGTPSSCHEKRYKDGYVLSLHSDGGTELRPQYP